MNPPYAQNNSVSDLDRRQSADALALGIDDLAIASNSEVPEWIQRLRVPSGWRTGHLAGAEIGPCRVAVCGQRADGGWDACETLSVFTFAGTPPDDRVESYCRRALAQFGIASPDTVSLRLPSLTGIQGVRCSGPTTMAAREVWIQFSCFVAAPRNSGKGFLIQQFVYVDAVRRSSLNSDVEHLADTLRLGFSRHVLRNS